MSPWQTAVHPINAPEESSELPRLTVTIALTGIYTPNLWLFITKVDLDGNAVETRLQRRGPSRRGLPSSRSSYT